MTAVMSRGALDGIKVVEFGDGVALAYCGALLRACGASVSKVEAPGRGDSVRHTPPFAEKVPSPEASGMHAFLNAGKRSAAIDITHPDGAELAAQLTADADLVLEALGPTRAEELDLGFSRLNAANPRLTMLSLSWFGADGQRRDWEGSDAIVQALAGFVYPIGEKQGPPMIPGGFNAQITAGVTAFVAVMGALYGALEGDPGVLIDQSVLEAQLTYTETSALRYAYDGAESVRKGINKFTPTYPQTIYPAADGWIGVTVLTPAQWRACCELIGAPQLIDDPRFRSSADRNMRSEELDPYLIPLFRKRSALEWFHEAQARRVPFALVPTMQDMQSLDHFEFREVLATFRHPDIGSFSAAAIPWKFAATPLARGGVAPRLGEHTVQVLREAPKIKHESIEPLVSRGIIFQAIEHLKVTSA
jgi:crotonobetainyl-CoA:carnitine CoA-transferase CaiB-like acyl-CoA transferase